VVPKLTTSSEWPLRCLSLFDSGEDEYGVMLPSMKGASNPVIARHPGPPCAPAISGKSGASVIVDI
jgi:hypothetical protein